MNTIKVVIFLSMIVWGSACTKSTRNAGDEPVKKNAASEQPNSDKPTRAGDDAVAHKPDSQDSDLTIAENPSGVKIEFAAREFEAYAINVDDLFYEASFVAEDGDVLASRDRTKLPFDATSKSAKITLEVKNGATGKVILKVEDSTQENKFAGESETIKVDGDTDVAIRLKKEGDANVTIDVDLSDLDGDGSGTGSGGSGRSNPTPGSEINYKPFTETLANSHLDSWMAADQAKRGDDAQYFKYAYVNTSMISDEKKANLSRVGLFKALNHTAVEAEKIHLGEDVSDGHGVMFAFDIRNYWGPNGQEALRKWQVVAGGQGKTVFASAPNQSLARFNSNRPIGIARLVYNLTHGKIYNVLTNNPPRENVLRQRLGVKNEVIAWSAQKEAIVYGPRIAWLRETADGRKYWATGDEFNGREGKEIPYMQGNPIPRFRGGSTDGMLAIKSGGAVASEAWVELKNGFISYYIWGNASQERTRAEQSFVIDPRNPQRWLINGRSCITCHVAGVQAAPSDMPIAIEQGRISQQYVERARSFWTPNETLAKLYGETRVKFRKAMTTVVEGVSDADKEFNNQIIDGVAQEPILMLINHVEQRRN